MRAAVLAIALVAASCASQPTVDAEGYSGRVLGGRMMLAAAQEYCSGFSRIAAVDAVDDAGATLWFVCLEPSPAVSPGT
jgi:hypothetical protein